MPSNETITSASITFFNIYNWTPEMNDKLYVTLLNTANSGVTIFTDNQASGNYFSGYGGQTLYYGSNPYWTDPDDNASVSNITFDIPVTNYSWLSDGNFGFGFDPDCHYYNTGVKVTITTALVPEPTSLLLLGFGLAGLAGLRRKFRG